MQHLKPIRQLAFNLTSLLSVCALFMACSQQPTKLSQAGDSAQLTQLPPESQKYSANVQLLSEHRHPDWRTKSYGYLLLAQGKDAPSKDSARSTCQALFKEGRLYDQPTFASSAKIPVTYMLANGVKDYDRVSARFKWSLCSQLSRVIDHEREQVLLEQFNLDSGMGPWLVHVPEPYRSNRIPENALALSLKGITGQNAQGVDIAELITQWKQVLRNEPQLGLQPGDQAVLHSRLSGFSTIPLIVRRIHSGPETPQLSMR